MLVNCIRRLCNMAFESGVELEDWRSAMILPLVKAKRERTEFKNYGGISLLSMARKIYRYLSRQSL